MTSVALVLAFVALKKFPIELKIFKWKCPLQKIKWPCPLNDEILGLTAQVILLTMPLDVHDVACQNM